MNGDVFYAAVQAMKTQSFHLKWETLLQLKAASFQEMIAEKQSIC